jgi:hypothetical protein
MISILYMSRILIDVGDERKKKMNLIVKGKNAKFKSYNELIRRLLDDYFQSIQINGIQSSLITSVKGKIPLSSGKISIKIDEKKASAFLEDKLIISKEDIKELIFYLWDNFKDYALEIEGLKSQDFVFSTFSDLNCWKMLLLENHKFPIIPLEIQNKKNPVRILAQVDTASSILLLDSSLENSCEREMIEKKLVLSPISEKEFEIYLITYKINDFAVKCETAFINFPPIFSKLKIQGLVGENLLRNLNLLVLYLSNVTCISRS